LRRQSIIRGYAEYQLEVTDDEDEDEWPQIGVALLSCVVGVVTS
jgi:hypothetical protein